MGLDHGFIHRRPDSSGNDYTFRKANHIHAWFINNYHGGIDDQKNFNIPVSGIKKFRDLLIQVITSLESSAIYAKDEKGEEYIQSFNNTDIARELLPPQSGFFFGDINIDRWYYEECKTALDMCDEILSTKPVGKITYWCWW